MKVSTQPREPHASVEAAWQAVYQAPRDHWELYELAEELIDLEDAFRQWRFRHVTTVERVIGFKRGTGGTAGGAYLRRMLDTVRCKIVANDTESAVFTLRVYREPQIDEFSLRVEYPEYTRRAAETLALLDPSNQPHAAPPPRTNRHLYDEANPLDPVANFYLGDLFFKEKKYQDATAYFSRVAYLPDYRNRLKPYWDTIEKEVLSR